MKINELRSMAELEIPSFHHIPLLMKVGIFINQKKTLKSKYFDHSLEYTINQSITLVKVGRFRLSTKTNPI